MKAKTNKMRIETAQVEPVCPKAETVDLLMEELSKAYGIRLPRQRDFPVGSPFYKLFSYPVTYKFVPGYGCYYLVTKPWEILPQVSIDGVFVYVDPKTDRLKGEIVWRKLITR